MDHRKLTDEELVRLLLATQDEDLRADLWVEFWRRFQPVIVLTVRRRIVRHIGRAQPALVEDLAQETFIKICKPDFKLLRNFEFRYENALRSWLKVMAAHVVEDYFRKQKIKEEELDPDFSSGRPDFPHKIDQRMKIQKIENCLQQLADKPNFPRDYKAFWLYYRDGLTAQSISQIPDIGFNGVKGVESALLRITKFVRQCLGPDSAKS
jgi:RNA polymerase sigma-70 factor (ECF subfamily)